MGLIANPSPLSFSTLLNVNLVCIVFYTDKVKKGTKACPKSALFILRGTTFVVQKITFFVVVWIWLLKVRFMSFIKLILHLLDFLK